MKPTINTNKTNTALCGLISRLALAAAFASITTPAQAGLIYVAAYPDSIEKIDSATGADLGVFASGLNAVTGVALDNSGNVYASTGPNGTNTIWKFTPAGVGSVFATNAWSGHEYVAFDSVGNLYASYWTSNVIQKYSPTGTDLGQGLRI